jgi:cytochrome c2
LLVLIPVSASAEDGAKLFTPCRACHSLDPADQGLPGPNLSSLIGRKVGGDAVFDYSPVLRKANAEGVRWGCGEAGSLPRRSGRDVSGAVDVDPRRRGRG